MPRAALIINPFSTAVTPQRVAEVEAVLGRQMELRTLETDRAGHATELASEVELDADAVLVFSGDGTYNEAINGASGRVPYGFIPGGGSSVLPRALGLPRDPIAAARRLADSVANGRSKRIGLGRANGRRFCFSAGVGFDAEVVRRVDQLGRSDDGRRAGNLAFITTGFRMLVEAHMHLDPLLEIEGVGRAAFVMVANGHPYTYAGPVAFEVTRDASFDGGLDFAAPRALGLTRILPLMVRARRGTVNRDPSVLWGHDLDRIVVQCDRPLALHVDGEDLGDVEQVEFTAERDAVAVLV